MFGRLHPVRQTFGSFARIYRHGDPAQNRACIQLPRNQVDRRTAVIVARVDSAAVRIQPLVSRQERRVYIQHPSGPAVYKPVRQNPHISGQCDIVRARIQDRGFHGRVMRIAAETAMGMGECGDTFRLGQFQARRVGPIAGDQNHRIGGVCQTTGMDERRHVGACPGDQDGNTRFRPVIRHCALRSIHPMIPTYRGNRQRCSRVYRLRPCQFAGQFRRPFPAHR